MPAAAYMSAASPFRRSSSRRSKSVRFGLDALAEYIDSDGVPRRSESVTRRMIQRGVSISKAITFSEDEQAHTSKAKREQDAERARKEAADLLASIDKKRERNSAMKARTKRERLDKVAEANAIVAERILLWYDQNNLSPQEQANADVTERNTPESPSKYNVFIDVEGNLRRRQAESIADPIEVAPTVIAPFPAANIDDKVAVVRPEMVTLNDAS